MAAELFTPVELAELEFAIALDPRPAPVIPGTGGFRKARWSRSGMGKRGGVRVIYYHAAVAELVLLIAVYAKNIQENLTNDQKKAIREAVRAFEENLPR